MGDKDTSAKGPEHKKLCLKRRGYRLLYQIPGCVDTNKKNVLKPFNVSFEGDRCKTSQSRDVRKGLNETRGSRTNTSSGANITLESRTRCSDRALRCGCGRKNRIQNSFTNWRSGEPNKTRFHTVNSDQNSHLLGAQNQNDKNQPYRPDSFVVIEGKYLQEIYDYIRHLRPRQKVAPVTTMQVTQFLRAKFGNAFSSHSIKHGAVRTLMRYMAQGKVELEHVMRIANHKHLSTLLRYSGINETTAIAMGRQNASVLL